MTYTPEEVQALEQAWRKQVMMRDVEIDYLYYSLRMANEEACIERQLRKRLEAQLAQYEQYNRTCAVLGIQPVTSLPDRSN